MKRVITLLLCIIFVAVPVSASTVSMEYDAKDIETPVADYSTPTIANATELNIESKSAVLMEPLTGKILYEVNPDEKLAPASITKIMSLLLIMEAIEAKRLTLETEITASEHACSMGGSQIWLEPGEKMVVNDLLKAAVIASANDATVALGEAVSGSEEGFVDMMNKRAKELGMNNTNFINCTGLDAEGHLTTAHDVAVMSSELIKHDLIKKYSTVWMDTLRNGDSELVNTNKLVRFYEGCTGLKTGTTSTAGHCLSATAEKQGMQLVAVVMGADNSPRRFEGAKKLLNYGYANFAFKKINAETDKNMQVKIKKGVKSSVGVQPGAVLNVLLPKATIGDITQAVEIKEDIMAPVKKGDIIGYVKINIGDNEAGVIELKAKDDVPKTNIWHTFIFLLKAIVYI